MAEPANGRSVPTAVADVRKGAAPDSPAVLAPGPSLRRHSAPFFLVSSPDPLGGARKAERDLKFWKQDGDGDEDSDVEEGAVVQNSPTSSSDGFVFDAVQAGFTADDLVRAESQLLNNFNSPKFGSVECAAGHGRHPRSIATRITEAIVDMRASPTSRQWRGPLPKPRQSPTVSLGDVWIKDSRSSKSTNKKMRLKEVCSVGAVPRSCIGEFLPVASPVMSVDAPMDLRFEFQTQKTLHLLGPVEQTNQCMGRVRIGAHPAFQCSIGLGVLLARKGVPRCFQGRQRVSVTQPKASPRFASPRTPSYAEAVRATVQAREKLERREGEMVQRGGQAVTGASRGWGGRAPHPSQDAFGGRGTTPHGRGAFFGSGQGFRSGGRGVFGGGGRGRGGLHQRFGGRGGRSFGGSIGGLGTDKQGWQEVAKGPRDSSHEVKAFEQMTKKSGEDLAMDGSADVPMEDIQEQADGDGKVVRTGARCSRCTKKGHVAANCSAEIYCVICDSHEHVNHRCPILKMPRPVAHAVGYAVHGLGFYHIPHPPLPRARKDSKMALISVIGGSLSKVQVISQLQRVVPVKWTWVLKDHGDGEFIAQFPSKSELQRSIAFGGADVKEVGVPQGVRLKFEEWHEKEEGFLLPKVWIRVVGLRKTLKEFLNLWAGGSMLGSTQAVDMETTRKEDFGRILVAVLNPKLIPAHLDVVIGDHYFELDFEVEKRGFDENGEEGDIEWNGGDNGENDNNNDGGYDGNENGTRDNFENDDLLDDLEENRENKRQRSEDGKKVGEHPPNDSVAGIHSMKEKIQNMSEAEFTQKLLWCALLDLH